MPITCFRITSEASGATDQGTLVGPVGVSSASTRALGRGRGCPSDEDLVGIGDRVERRQVALVLAEVDQLRLAGLRAVTAARVPSAGERNAYAWSASVTESDPMSDQLKYCQAARTAPSNVHTV